MVKYLPCATSKDEEGSRILTDNSVVPENL
jgi:hypothetical protein